MHSRVTGNAAKFPVLWPHLNKAKGNMHLFEQLKEIPMCDPGSGSVWRVRYNPKTSDPSHIAALVCDFSQQIIINSTLGEATVTCVVRGKPAFDW